MIDEGAYSAWLDALRNLTGTADKARALQEHRFAFAHRLRVALLDDDTLGRKPLLYGVALESAGWVYVGQTQNGRRRLRDLPVGESHHLSNTFPPELWHRIVILHWPMLVEGLALPDQKTTGVALERLLQRHVQPLFNSRRKATTGEWRPVDFDQPAERAAADPSVQELWRKVVAAWDFLASLDEVEVGRSRVGRVVFPGRL